MSLRDYLDSQARKYFEWAKQDARYAVVIHRRGNWANSRAWVRTALIHLKCALASRERARRLNVAG
jgi:hypothetical protein